MAVFRGSRRSPGRQRYLLWPALLGTATVATLALQALHDTTPVAAPMSPLAQRSLATPAEQEPARPASVPPAASHDTAAHWSRAMRGLSQQTPALLVHRAAVSKQAVDVFAAYALMRHCRRSANQAMVAYAAPSASERMKQAISQFQERCSQSGNRQQLDYVVQSWPADSPERQGFEAAKRVDRAGVVSYVLSTGSGDFAAQLLPGYIDVELLEARGLLPPLTPEAADLEGTGPHFDLASVSRMRDQFAVSWAVTLWSCNRMGTCAEEAQLDYKCHPLRMCVDDLRDFPEQMIFRRGPLDASGTPNLFWVSRTRWAQIQQAVNQLLAGLH